MTVSANANIKERKFCSTKWNVKAARFVFLSDSLTLTDMKVMAFEHCIVHDLLQPGYDDRASTCVCATSLSAISAVLSSFFDFLGILTSLFGSL
jgi:hypothetical protein